MTVIDADRPAERHARMHTKARVPARLILRRLAGAENTAVPLISRSVMLRHHASVTRRDEAPQSSRVLGVC